MVINTYSDKLLNIVTMLEKIDYPNKKKLFEEITFFLMDLESFPSYDKEKQEFIVELIEFFLNTFENHILKYYQELEK